MSAQFLDAINWQRPWLKPLVELAAPILRAADWRAALNAMASEKALRNYRGLPIQFVPQSALPAGTAYETFISATGGVPTRDNLHDFFNALVWQAFPNIKVQLNALQAADIARAAAQPASRGKLRDAATIFDENAALLAVHDTSLIDPLRAHRWHELFVTRRSAFERDCEVWMFGHALMEKLVNPYKAITAHVWPVIVDAGFLDMPMVEKLAWLDVSVAAQLTGGLSTSSFLPLPVAGVPGWWEEQDQAFYADQVVFRSVRRNKSSSSR